MHSLAQTQTNHLRPTHWSEGWEKAHLRSREARPLGIPHPPPIIMIISFHINFWLHLKLKESQSLPFNHAKSAILHLLGTYHSTAQSILLRFITFYHFLIHILILSSPPLSAWLSPPPPALARAPRPTAPCSYPTDISENCCKKAIRNQTG